MRINSESNLVDAFAAWGAHEAAGRCRNEVQFDLDDASQCLDFILKYRSPYIGRLLFRCPVRVLEVELEPADRDKLFLASGASFEQWIRKVSAGNSNSFAHFQALVQGSDAPAGPLIGAATLLDQATNSVGPICLYDGWHRAAAWSERLKLGRASDIFTYLFITQREDAILESSCATAAV